jgi:hypothetical protein
MAWGDYDYGDRRITKMTGRHIFHDAIAVHRPMTLADLARDPLEAFQASPLFANDFQRLDLCELLLNPNASMDWHVHDSRCDRVLSALQSWGERWNLSAPWCQAHALNTLHRWSSNPENVGRWWGFGDFKGSGLHPGESIFALHIDDYGWDPSLMHWDYYEQAILSQVAAYVLSYKERMEGLVEAIGMTRVENKAKLHFEWLAVYQTSDYGYPTMLKIARKHQPSLTASGLYQALASAAKLIELPLRRSAQKGRKRGSGDRSPRRHIVRHKKNPRS